MQHFPKWLHLVRNSAKCRDGAQRRWLENGTLEFTLGNYRLWLKGYVAHDNEGALRLTADTDPAVLIDCPALIGLIGEYSKFGRAKRGPGCRHQTGAVDLA